jgi:hypothetical protein
LHGDFTPLIGMPNPWSDNEGKRHYWRRGVALVTLFGIVSLLLITSIVRTIITNPGSIPDDKEWDMQTDQLTDHTHSDISQSDDEKKRSKE